MNQALISEKDGILCIALTGHIDSNNASEIEETINDQKKEYTGDQVVIDANHLQYISSAGLRILLRLKKSYPALKIINVNSDVYEVFDMTGFTEMMDIQKAYRVISIDGCEVIGQGANGKVYRIDPDTIVKVYLNPDSLPDIKRERELARTALILGIPTAIPYDVVRVGNSYGSVFELLNAKSFAKLIIADPTALDEVVHMSVDLLKKIHHTEVKPGTMPAMKETVLNWVTFLQEYLPEEKYQKLFALVNAVPEDPHMLHGDYHIKNVMLQNGETLLIDMDTICTGHPVFEFASIYNAYQGFYDIDHTGMEQFLGITYEQGTKIWNKTLAYYFDDRNTAEIHAIADKAKLLGHVRIMRRAIRRNGYETEEGKLIIEHSKQTICDLLETVDTLLF